MTTEEKAQEICEKNKRFKVECSSLECYLSAMEMAKWKDSVFKGFLFELSLLLTEPKTSIEHAICHAFPMAGLNATDEVGDFLREKLWEYEHNGTILKNE